MMRKFLALVMILTAGATRADVPAVLTDIAPVQSLVAQVMGDLGTPQALLSPQDDPHHFQMRPSQARLMAGADLVIWMGEAMTPWLPRVIGNLGEGIASLELLDLPALPMLIEGNLATLHAPGDPVPERQDSHSHGAIDPHAWLDPDNARAFLGAIAETLARADPANAATYRANAETAQARIAAMKTDIATRLAPMRHVTLVPYHDAYRYFFIRFDLKIRGAIADSEAAPPGAAHLVQLRHTLAATNRFCVFAEPGANLDLIRTVLPTSDKPIPALDPLGSGLPPGPDLYETLMRRMADTFATCETP